MIHVGSKKVLVSFIHRQDCRSIFHLFFFFPSAVHFAICSPSLHLLLAATAIPRDSYSQVKPERSLLMLSRQRLPPSQCSLVLFLAPSQRHASLQSFGFLGHLRDHYPQLQISSHLNPHHPRPHSGSIEILTRALRFAVP